MPRTTGDFVSMETVLVALNGSILLLARVVGQSKRTCKDFTGGGGNGSHIGNEARSRCTDQTGL